MKKLPPIRFKIRYFNNELIAEYIFVRRSLYNELVLLLSSQMPFTAMRRMQRELHALGFQNNTLEIAGQITTKITIPRRITNEADNSSTITSIIP